MSVQQMTEKHGTILAVNCMSVEQMSEDKQAAHLKCRNNTMAMSEKETNGNRDPDLPSGRGNYRCGGE